MEEGYVMTSFGEYFDNQRDAMIKAMQNKNKQQNVEWMEAYKRKQLAKKIYQEDELYEKDTPRGG
jgi:cobalamin biosynthesis Co2+ chelatase CbiK